MSEKKEKPEDQPLKVQVADGRLVISIGVETLRYCHNQIEEMAVHEGTDRKGYLIENAEGFARDVESELRREREDGSTILTDLLDEATGNAADNGSEHAVDSIGWYCEQCDKGMLEKAEGFLHSDGIRYCSHECAEERDANR